MDDLKKISKEIAKGGSQSFLLKIFVNFAGIVITIVLARGIGAEHFGIYSLAVSIIYISSKISVFGMNNAILRFFPVCKKDKRDLRGLIFSSFSITLFLSGTLLVLYYIGAREYVNKFFNMAGLDDVISKLLIVLPFIIFTQLAASLFQAEKKIVKYINYSDLYQKLFFLTFLAALSLTSISLSNVVYAFEFSVFVVFIMSLFELTKRFHPQIKRTKARFRIKELISFSAPSFLIGFSFVLLMQIDRIMVGLLMDSHSVGVYSVSAKIAVFMNIVLVSMNSIFVPYISELYWNKRKKELSTIFQLVTKWTLIFSIVLFVFFFYGAEYILNSFGNEFPAGQSAFIILAFGFLLNCGFGSNGFMLQMTGHQNIEFFNSVVVLILNVFFNIQLVPIYGIAGAAMATCLSMLLINIARLVEFLKFSGIQPIGKAWLKVALLFVIIFSSSLFLRRFLGMNLIGDLLSFCVFCTIFSIFVYKNVIEDRDIMILSQVRQKVINKF